MPILTDDEIKARLQPTAMPPLMNYVMPVIEHDEREALPIGRKPYRYVKPLSAAAESFIEVAQNPEGRFMFGIQPIDAKIRGIGRGELMYITGRAHSGKTQLVLQAIANNPGARVVFFTPDEVAELILAKLFSMTRGINGELLEERVKRGDVDTIAQLRTVASHDFANLIVIDQSLTFDQMTQALKEARDYWGADEDIIVIDFLELLMGDGDVSGVTQKSQNLKRWVKDADSACICLHQASRSSGSRGQAAGMGAMRYGGETEAMYVIEVYRKREDMSLDQWERDDHEDTITIGVEKNKRPPCHVGSVDLWLDPSSGCIRTKPPVIDDGAIAMTPAEALARARAASR